MTASDYPISFPYGSTEPPYSASHPHRGDDRACPQGTPIVINGVTIGLTGATGKVTGPHLHVQETQGGYLNTRKPQNAFKGGTVVNIDPNGTQGDGSFGKFIDIKTDDGWTDSYCHLSQINVKVGQKLGGENMGLTLDQVKKICYMATDLPAESNQNFLNNVGSDLDTVLDNFLNYSESRALRLDAEDYRAGNSKSGAGQLNKTSVIKYLNDNLK